MEAIQRIRDMMERDWNEEDYEEFDEQVFSGDQELVETLIWWFGSLCEVGPISEWRQVGLEMIIDEE